MITMFGGMAFAAIPILLYVFVFKETVGLVLYVWLCAAVFVVLCIALLRYLVTAGAKRFARL